MIFRNKEANQTFLVYHEKAKDYQLIEAADADSALDGHGIYLQDVFVSYREDDYKVVGPLEFTLVDTVDRGGFLRNVDDDDLAKFAALMKPKPHVTKPKASPIFREGRVFEFPFLISYSKKKMRVERVTYA